MHTTGRLLNYPPTIMALLMSIGAPPSPEPPICHRVRDERTFAAIGTYRPTILPRLRTSNEQDVAATTVPHQIFSTAGGQHQQLVVSSDEFGCQYALGDSVEQGATEKERAVNDRNRDSAYIFCKISIYKEGLLYGFARPQFVQQPLRARQLPLV